MAAGDIKLNRIFPFYGGITLNERDRRLGYSLNIEEVDIFENESFVGPATIFAADAVITRQISGYTKDEADNVYALGRTADVTPLAQIWRKTTGSADVPGAWASFFTSTRNSLAPSPVIWHKWDSGADYLYYVTGTQTLVRLGDLATTTESTTDVNGTAMTLTGLGASDDRIPIIRTLGELFIGHGQFIAKVDDDGVFTQKAFTLPNGWECVDFTTLGTELVIIARSIETGSNFSKIYLWDRTATTGVTDQIDLPTGGPQIVQLHNEILRAVCAINGRLKIYQLDGKVPRKTHELTSIRTETGFQAIIPAATKFVLENLLYFGIYKTDTTGLYALGQLSEDKPAALILAKRFSATDYSLHTPYAALATGPNFYASFDDNGTKSVAKLEGNNSPTRSSNAVIETIWIDDGRPEIWRHWDQFVAITKAFASTQNIRMDARVDNASGYDVDSLNTFTGDGAITSFIGNFSLRGKACQIRIRFASSGTSRPVLFTADVRSVEEMFPQSSQ